MTLTRHSERRKGCGTWLVGLGRRTLRQRLGARSLRAKPARRQSLYQIETESLPRLIGD